MGWQLGQGPKTQKSALPWLTSTAPATAGTGGYRQLVRGSWHRLWHCHDQRAWLRWPWGWTRAACADLPGSSREWLGLSFPDAELLAKPGTFQSALLSTGFPPDCRSERKPAQRQRRAGQPAPAPRPSCSCSGVARATAGHGMRRFRRRWLGWGTAGDLPWSCAGRATVGIGHQPLPLAPGGSSWGASVCLSSLSGRSVRSSASPRAGHQPCCWGQCGTCDPGATGSIFGLSGREGSQPWPLGAVPVWVSVAALPACVFPPRCC